MNHSVVGRDIGRNNFGAIHTHAAHGRVDRKSVPFDSLGVRLLSGEARAHDLSRDDVVGQDLDKLGLVFRLYE